MEDNLISLSCPNCSNSLFEAALMNPMFLHRADCPFCGLAVRWSRLPVTLMFAGAIMFGASVTSIILKLKIPVDYVNSPALGAGLGVGCLIFGLLFLRFVSVNKNTNFNRTPKNHLGHVHN